MKSDGNSLNKVSFLVAHFFVLCSCTGNNPTLFFCHFSFWPGALGFFQIFAGVLLKFVWLVHCEIIFVCYDVAWFHVWSSVRLIFFRTHFWISKICFQIRMYPERDLIFLHHQPFFGPGRVQNCRFCDIWCPFLCALRYIWRCVFYPVVSQIFLFTRHLYKSEVYYPYLYGPSYTWGLVSDDASVFFLFSPFGKKVGLWLGI